jgi:uncharacterized membrane protein
MPSSGQRSGAPRPSHRFHGLLASALTQTIVGMLSYGCGPSTSRTDTDTSASAAAGDTTERAAGATATPWEEARRRGVEFRAIGQEPGWSLDIDQGGMIEYAGDYGQTRISVPTPDAERDTAARRTSYAVRSDSHDIAIVIREEACQDVMSGEAFTHAVTVRADGKEVRGCGRVLVAGGLEKSR